MALAGRAFTSLPGPSRLQCRRCRRVLLAAPRCDYSFASSSRVKPPLSGRRNRAVEKRAEQELRGVVHGLCAFNAKQLQAVAHLLRPEHVAAVRVAADIPPTNQGRRRQEGLVMKLLRADLSTPALEKLARAVVLAERNLAFADDDVEQHVDAWLECVIADDPAVAADLQGQPGVDWQQLRSWARQVQQHQLEQQQLRQQQRQQQEEEEQQRQQRAAALAAAANGGGGGEGEGGGDGAGVVAPSEEVLTLMAELQQQKQQQQQKPAGTKSGSGKKQQRSATSRAASAARRSIRKVLLPLAIERLGGGVAGGGGGDDIDSDGSGSGSGSDGGEE